jgi:hypothetical protein
VDAIHFCHLPAIVIKYATHHDNKVRRATTLQNDDHDYLHNQISLLHKPIILGEHTRPCSLQLPWSLHVALFRTDATASPLRRHLGSWHIPVTFLLRLLPSPTLVTPNSLVQPSAWSVTHTPARMTYSHMPLCRGVAV